MMKTESGKGTTTTSVSTWGECIGFAEPSNTMSIVETPRTRGKILAWLAVLLLSGCGSGHIHQTSRVAIYVEGERLNIEADGTFHVGGWRFKVEGL